MFYDTTYLDKRCSHAITYTDVLGSHVITYTNPHIHTYDILMSIVVVMAMGHAAGNPTVTNGLIGNTEVFPMLKHW